VKDRSTHSRPQACHHWRPRLQGPHWPRDRRVAPAGPRWPSDTAHGPVVHLKVGCSQGTLRWHRTCLSRRSAGGSRHGDGDVDRSFRLVQFIGSARHVDRSGAQANTDVPRLRRFPCTLPRPNHRFAGVYYLQLTHRQLGVRGDQWHAHSGGDLRLDCAEVRNWPACHVSPCTAHWSHFEAQCHRSIGAQQPRRATRWPPPYSSPLFTSASRAKPSRSRSLGPIT